MASAIDISFHLCSYSYCSIRFANRLNWNTQDGEKLPISEIDFKDETFRIPLREAPFCHLWVTNKCQCLGVREDPGNTEWTITSFAYCGGRIKGYFMNEIDNFEIVPIENGDYNITQILTENNETADLTDDVYIEPASLILLCILNTSNHCKNLNSKIMRLASYLVGLFLTKTFSNVDWNRKKNRFYLARLNQ